MDDARRATPVGRRGRRAANDAERMAALGRVGAYRRLAAADPRAMTAPARAAFLARFRERARAEALARGEAITLRFALVYALLDRSPVIGADHLVAALALWQYAEDSARHVFGDATGDPVADRVLAALRRGGAMAQDEVRDLFGRHSAPSASRRRWRGWSAPASCSAIRKRPRADHGRYGPPSSFPRFPRVCTRRKGDHRMSYLDLARRGRPAGALPAAEAHLAEGASTGCAESAVSAERPAAAAGVVANPWTAEMRASFAPVRHRVPAGCLAPTACGRLGPCGRRAAGHPCRAP